MTAVRRLALMRHAKAEPFAGTDFTRRLTERGRVDAADAGRFLAGAGLVPDRVLVSGAVRAQETWAAVAEHLGAQPRVHVLEALYGAGPDEVLEALRLVEEDTGTLLYVGHNPAAAMVATLLDDGAGDPTATAAMYQGFPTSAVVAFEVPGAWADLAEGAARVLSFHVGRG